MDEEFYSQYDLQRYSQLKKQKTFEPAPLAINPTYCNAYCTGYMLALEQIATHLVISKFFKKDFKIESKKILSDEEAESLMKRMKGCKNYRKGV